MRRTILPAVAALVVGAVVAFVPAEPAERASPAVLKLDRGEFRYTFQVLTGDEALFDVRTVPRGLHDLCRSHPAKARELRHALELELGVESLETLRRDRGDEIRTLRTLGYL